MSTQPPVIPTEATPQRRGSEVEESPRQAESTNEAIHPTQSQTRQNLRDMFAAGMLNLSGVDVQERDVEKLERTHASLLKKLPQLTREWLGSSDVYVGLKAIPLIKEVPESERTALRKTAAKILEAALAGRDPYYRYSAVPLIKEVLESERTTLVQMALADNKCYVQCAAVPLIKEVPEQERADLYKTAVAMVERMLARKYGLEIGRVSIPLIKELPEQERAALYKNAVKVLEATLAGYDPIVRYDAIRWIRELPEPERTALYKTAIKKVVLEAPWSDITYEAYCYAISLIREVEDVKERKRLEALFVAKVSRLINWDFHPSWLHLFAGVSRLSMGAKGTRRRTFPKSGSETLLLGKVRTRGKGEEIEHEWNLKGKAVFRIIPIGAYLSWYKAYTMQPEFWRQKGFNYNPIEPIISVAVAQENNDLFLLRRKRETMLFFDMDGHRFERRTAMVRVGTRVINGPSAKEWMKKTTLHWKSIDEQITALKQALAEMDVEHGHLHYSNFVLLFERDAQGQPDITKPPRVYVIDFDQAISNQTAT